MILHCELLQFLGNDLVRLLKDLNEHARLLRLILSKQSISDSVLVPCAASPPNAVDVVFLVLSAVVVYHSLNRRDVEAPTRHVCGQEYVGLLGFKLL